MIDYVPFIIFLMILAVYLRVESALTILYMILGIFMLSLYWGKRAIRHIEIKRDYESHAFFGDKIPVQLTIRNKSLIPILWLEIHESLPVNLRAGKNVGAVMTLGVKGTKTITYQCQAFKRGYYSLGPLTARTGDPLGLLKPSQREIHESAVTVYPQIFDLEDFGLPSRSPFGNIKHKNPIFEDPSRILGKRDFIPGDPIKRIDWKSSAATNKLQVKFYESSIALDVAVLLDLDNRSYAIKTFYDATELAITAGASIAAWCKAHQQPFGLITNGIDPELNYEIPPPLLPKKSTGQFITILEYLARIQPGEQIALDQLLHNTFFNLSWGTTIILISGGLNETNIEQLFQAKKIGINPVIILTGQFPELSRLRNLANYYSIPIHLVTLPSDLRTLGSR